jgi:hypothetical protein
MYIFTEMLSWNRIYCMCCFTIRLANRNATALDYSRFTCQVWGIWCLRFKFHNHALLYLIVFSEKIVLKANKQGNYVKNLK